MVSTRSTSTSVEEVEQLAELDLLNAEHIAKFHRAVDNVALAEVVENAYAEIIDSLLTKESWLDFNP